MFGIPLNYHPSATYLGVELERKLTFLPPIQDMYKRAVSRVLTLYPMLKSQTLSLETRLHIYCVMVRPLCCSDLETCRQNLYQQASNRSKSCCAACIVNGQSKDTRITHLHEDLYLPLLTKYIEILSRPFWTRVRNSHYAQIQTIGTIGATIKKYC